jgi:membrane associated rhomboid family serine protease
MSNFNSNSNVGDAPLQDNPIRAFFDNYQRETPMATRTIMATQAIAYTVNIFFDLSLGLGNIPVFTVYKFEIYRIFTSLFVCTTFFSVILAYFNFLPTGKRLEYSMGSTEFACVLLTIGVMTNVLYICLAFLLDGLQGSQYWLVIPSFGLWNILFGVIALECTKAPQNSVRKFLFWTIPTLYYPMALLVFFSFLGGFSLAHCISIGVGYGFGYGYLEYFRISASRCKVWEEKYLQSFISLDGNFIVSSTAMGSGAWSDDATTQQAEDQNDLNGLFSRLTSHTQQQQSGTSDVPMGSEDTSVPGASRPGRVIKPSPRANYKNDANVPIPTSGGQQLGGVSRTQNQDPRQARLQALERRMATNHDHQ